jgi:hypothetical protein
MIVHRYNVVTGKYTDANVPNDWKISVKEEDNNNIINCIHCGQQISFKESFESKRYNDEHGRSYRECSTCYNNFLPLTKFQ